MTRACQRSAAVLVLAPALFVAGSVPRAQTPTSSAGPAAAAATKDVKKGQQLFTSSGCYQCHGRVAQGAVSGPRLAPRPLPAASFSRYVRRPTGQMPPYTFKVLSDQDLEDIYAFLLAIPEPRPLATIPLLNQ